MEDADTRRHDAEARINTAICNAKHALIVRSAHQLPTAMTETYAALMALSAYLALPSGSPKAAAIARHIAKLWKSIIKLSRHHGNSTISSAPSEDDHFEELSMPETSMYQHHDGDEEENSTVQQLREQLVSMQEERSISGQRLNTLQEELESLKKAIAVTQERSEVHEITIEQLQSRNKSLTEKLEKENIRARRLEHSLMETEELLQQLSAESSSLKESNERLTNEIRQHNAAIAEEQEIKNKSPAIDRDEYEALKEQVPLLHQTLRNICNSSAAAEIKSGRKTLADVEAEHHEQLIAIKLTISQQCKREDKLLQTNKELQHLVDEKQETIEHERKKNKQIVNNVEKNYREKLADAVTAAEQEREQHAHELEVLRSKLKEEHARTEALQRAATENVDSVEQEREQHAQELEVLRGTLQEEREQHAQELEVLRSTLQEEREQLAHELEVLRSTLQEEREQHAHELEVLRSTLQEEREQHAQELEVLRSKLKEEHARTEALQRAATENVGSVEQNYREQLAVAVAAAEQERKQYFSEVKMLKYNISVEKGRVNDLLREMEEREKRYMEDLSAVNADHATERSVFLKKLVSVQRLLEEMKGVGGSSSNVKSGFEESLSVSASEKPPYTNGRSKSTVDVLDERHSLLKEVAMLRLRCLSVEQEVANAAESSRENAATVAKLAEKLGGERPRLDSAIGASSAAALRAGDTCRLDKSVRYLRDLVLSELIGTTQRTFVRGEETQALVSVAKSLCSAISELDTLTAELKERHHRIARQLNVGAAKQSVALQKIYFYLSESSSLQVCDAAIFEACLLVFSDVRDSYRVALGLAVENQKGVETRVASQTGAAEERRSGLGAFLQSAPYQVQCGKSGDEFPSCADLPQVQGAEALRRGSKVAPSLILPSGSRRGVTSPPGECGKNETTERWSGQTPVNSSHRRSKSSNAGGGLGNHFEDPFRYAVATLSAQEKRYAQHQQQKSMMLKR